MSSLLASHCPNTPFRLFFPILSPWLASSQTQTEVTVQFYKNKDKVIQYTHSIHAHSAVCSFLSLPVTSPSFLLPLFAFFSALMEDLIKIKLVEKRFTSDTLCSHLALFVGLLLFLFSFYLFVMPFLRAHSSFQKSFWGICNFTYNSF